MGVVRVQVIGGVSTAQQLLGAGLLDQVQISFLPVLLGEGLRLFEHLSPRVLEKLETFDSPVRTDVRYAFRR